LKDESVVALKLLLLKTTNLESLRFANVRQHAGAQNKTLHLFFCVACRAKHDISTAKSFQTELHTAMMICDILQHVS